MILNSIVIENIRSYVHEEVEFLSGISLFEGDIGSGKSTILMAIEFALFGLGSQKPESLLAKKEDAGYVILEFSVDGRRYEVKRALKRTSQGINQNPKQSWLKTGGTKELLSPSDLKQRVLEILRFNESADSRAESRIFRYAVFTPQEAMKDVLFDTERRLETVRKAFQIEEYSTAESNSRELLSEIRMQMASMDARFSNIPELESQIKSSEDAIAAAHARIQEEQERQKTLDGGIAAAQAVLDRLQERNDARIRLESAITGLKNRIGDRNDSVRRMEQDAANHKSDLDRLGRERDGLAGVRAPDTKMSLAEMTSEIKRFQQIGEDLAATRTKKESITREISRLQVELGDTDSDIESANGTLESLQAQKESCDPREDEVRAKLDDARSQKTRMQAEKDRLGAEIDRFARLGSRCPTCDQTIGEQHSHAMVGDKKASVLELGKKLAPVGTLISQLALQLEQNAEQRRSFDHEIHRIREAIRTITMRDELLAQAPSLDAGIRMFNLQYSQFDGGDPIGVLGRLKDDLVQYEHAAGEIRRIEQAMQKTDDTIQRIRADMESATSQISDWQSELNRNESDLGSLEDVAGMMSEANRNLDRLREEHTSVMSNIAVAESTLDGKQDIIEQDRARLAESQRWKSRHGRFSQTREWLEGFFIPTIALIEKQVLLTILQKFNETYHDWYSMLVDDPTKESRIDENFTPMVEQDGYEQKIAFLSGGEKTSIALAYRLTLNLLVRDADSIKSNLLILDEPTDGFSKDQLDKVRQILNCMESEQIILVSHERDLETCADHVFQVSKDAGVSRVSRTSRV